MYWSRLLAVAAIAAVAHSVAAAKEAPASAVGRIQADMTWLADDARMGREAGTKEYDAAARYATKRMKAIGLKPAGKDGWKQVVPLRAGVRDLDAAQFSLVDTESEAALAHLDDYIIGTNLRNARFDVAAPLAYVGYGVTAPEEGIDDYDGVDATGKIIIFFNGAPPTLNNEKRAYYSSGEVQMKNAAAHGAVGVISIQTASSAERTPWDRIVKGVGRKSMTTIGPDGLAEVDAPTITATASMSPAGSEKLFAGEQMDFATLQKKEAEGKGAPKAFDLKKRARIAGATVHSDAKSANIIGIIEGSDPRLKDEVVLLTAHLDHIGVSPAAKPGEDAINNGALDNASGVSVMLEAARMFSKSGAKPKRTVAFVALTGEEKGLLGSEYLAKHPAFGGRRVVSNVNLDMPIALYPFSDVIAFGAERSSLGPIVAAAANEMGVALAEDPIPQESLFVRSDHYSFVKEGVPSVFLVPGWANGGEKAFGNFLKTHYHKPSDDMSLPIDFDALARFSDLNYRISRALADAPDAPAWVEGDFFGEIFSK